MTRWWISFPRRQKHFPLYSELMQSYRCWVIMNLIKHVTIMCRNWTLSVIKSMWSYSSRHVCMQNVFQLKPRQYLLFAAVNLPFLLWRECKHGLPVLICKIQFILETTGRKCISNAAVILQRNFRATFLLKKQRASHLPSFALAKHPTPSPKLMAYTGKLSLDIHTFFSEYFQTSQVLHKYDNK